MNKPDITNADVQTGNIKLESYNWTGMENKFTEMRPHMVS